MATQLLAVPRVGPANTRLALFTLTTLFKHTQIAQLDISVVRRTPRAMTVTAQLPPKLLTRLLTVFAETGLNVEAGLLSNSILGPAVISWVTYSCRRRLFDKDKFDVPSPLPILGYNVDPPSVYLM